MLTRLATPIATQVMSALEPDNERSKNGSILRFQLVIKRRICSSSTARSLGNLCAALTGPRLATVETAYVLLTLTLCLVQPYTAGHGEVLFNLLRGFENRP